MIRIRSHWITVESDFLLMIYSSASIVANHLLAAGRQPSRISHTWKLIDKSVYKSLEVLKVFYLFVLIVIVIKNIISCKMKTMKYESAILKRQPNCIIKRVPAFVGYLNSLAIL